MKLKFSGTGVALITPFHKDKSIDFTSLGKVIDYCLNGGVDYLVTLGTTGETVVLSNEEKQKVIDFTVQHVNGRCPIVAGFGGNNTALIIDEIAQFNLQGIDAVLSSSPNYNKPTQEGIYQHYKAIANSTKLPVILYNVPGRTAKNVTAKTVIRLANDCSNVIAVKDASCDMLQCMEIVKGTPKDFLLLSGDDVHALPMFSFGAKGVISVIAQGIPNTFTSMVNAALDRDFEKASTLQFTMLPIIDMIFEENNPAGIKALLHYRGICDNELRLPLVPATEKLYKKIASEVDSPLN